MTEKNQNVCGQLLQSGVFLCRLYQILVRTRLWGLLMRQLFYHFAWKVTESCSSCGGCGKRRYHWPGVCSNIITFHRTSGESIPAPTTADVDFTIQNSNPSLITRSTQWCLEIPFIAVKVQCLACGHECVAMVTTYDINLALNNSSHSIFTSFNDWSHNWGCQITDSGWNKSCWECTNMIR